MDIGWDDLRLFLAVAEAGSMNQAARRLKLGQPTVSRRVAALEGLVGESLFRRSVEGVALTDAGRRLLEPARHMAEWAAEVERARDREITGPEGVVRVTAAPGVSYELLAPFAASCRQRLPGVVLEVIATVGYLDLARREADLALRNRRAEGDLVGVTDLEFENVAHAAPELVRALPRRYTLADVPWIGWAPPLDELTPNRELAQAIPGFRPVFASNDFLVQLRAAEAGVGAVFRARVRNRFAAPTRLVPLRLDLGAHARGRLHLVSTKSALEIPRVRAVAELLSAELRRARL